jgi:hypothetical protein
VSPNAAFLQIIEAALTLIFCVDPAPEKKNGVAQALNFWSARYVQCKNKN